MHELPTPPASAPSQPLTRRERRDAERLAELQAQAPAAPLAFASRRERRAAERASEAAVTTAPVRITGAVPVTRRVVRPVTAPLALPLAARPARSVVAATPAPELPAVVIPAAVTSAPELPALAELAADEFGIDEAIVAADEIDEIELPVSFRRNLAAAGTVSPVRRGSKRALVRVRRGVTGTTKRGAVVRGAAGITALGVAASVAVATTLPAAAENGSAASQASLDAAVNEAGGAQTLSVGSTSAEIDTVSASSDRAPAYAVATMGTATAYSMTFGVPRPDPNAYQNNLTAAVQWPFPVGVVISDYFGQRVAPCSWGCSSDHKGVDFTPGEGTPIGSIAAGRVITANEVDNGGLGVYVEVEHVIDGQRVVSVYGHMLTGSIAVQVGQVVQVGDELGKVGNTGTSTGAHLHLEVHIGGEKVDPYAFLQAHNVPETVVERPDASVQA